MQQLVIEPQRSLGPFVLGSTFNDVVAVVQKDSGALRDNHIAFDQHVHTQHTPTTHKHTNTQTHKHTTSPAGSRSRDSSLFPSLSLP